jgi:hypothetical protein
MTGMTLLASEERFFLWEIIMLFECPKWSSRFVTGLLGGVVHSSPQIFWLCNTSDFFESQKPRRMNWECWHTVGVLIKNRVVTTHFQLQLPFFRLLHLCYPLWVRSQNFTRVMSTTLVDLYIGNFYLHPHWQHHTSPWLFGTASTFPCLC